MLGGTYWGGFAAADISIEHGCNQQRTVDA